MEGDENDIFERANEKTWEEVQARFERENREAAGPVVCEIWDRMQEARAEFERVMHALEMELLAADYADEADERVLDDGLWPQRRFDGALGFEAAPADATYILPTALITAQEDADDSQAFQTGRFYDRAGLRILQAMSQLEAKDGTDTEPSNPDWTYQ